MEDNFSGLAWHDLSRERTFITETTSSTIAAVSSRLLYTGTQRRKNEDAEIEGVVKRLEEFVRVFSWL